MDLTAVDPVTALAFFLSGVWAGVMLDRVFGLLAQRYVDARRNERR